MEDEIIPYDKDEREAKFPKAHEELAEFVRKWRSLEARGVDYIRELFRTQGPAGQVLRL